MGRGGPSFKVRSSLLSCIQLVTRGVLVEPLSVVEAVCIVVVIYYSLFTFIGVHLCAAVGVSGDHARVVHQHLSSHWGAMAFSF